MFAIIEHQACIPGVFDDVVIHEIFPLLDGFSLWTLRRVSRAWQDAITPSMVTTLVDGIVRTSSATDTIVKMTNLEKIAIMYTETSPRICPNSGGAINELAMWEIHGIVPDTLKNFPKLRELSVHIEDLVEDSIFRDYASALNASCPDIQYVSFHLGPDLKQISRGVVDSFSNYLQSDTALVACHSE